MAERKQTLADLKKGDYRVDPTQLGRGARAALSESLLPERGPPVSIEEWAARNPPGRFDPVEAIVGLAGGPRLGARGIRAYHSSPHDFERFDLGRIGSGEGAQSYGHGLYFAENPSISGRGGHYWNQFNRRMPPEEMRAAEVLRRHNWDRDKAIQDLQGTIGKNDPMGKESGFGDIFQMMQEADKNAVRLLESGKPVGPRTYEVNINAQPEQFLDWDRPISRQSPQIQQVAGQLGGREPAALGSGSGFYRQLAENRVPRTQGLPPPPNDAAATAALREAGVPGIKYLDEGSRFLGSGPKDLAGTLLNAHGGNKDWAIAELKGRLRGGSGKGTDIPAAIKILEGGGPGRTSNYVVFNDKIIDVMKKYGIIGAAGGTAATKGDKASADHKEPNPVDPRGRAQAPDRGNRPGPRT